MLRLSQHEPLLCQHEAQAKGGSWTDEPWGAMDATYDFVTIAEFEEFHCSKKFTRELLKYLHDENSFILLGGAADFEHKDFVIQPEAHILFEYSAEGACARACCAVPWQVPCRACVCACVCARARDCACVRACECLRASVCLCAALRLHACV